MPKPAENKSSQPIKRHKEQGEYRLNKALRELDGLTESIKQIEDTIDKENAQLEIY